MIDKYQYIKYLIFAFIGAISQACDEVIYPDLPESPAYLVIDAWITNEPLPQVIRLTRATPYFQNEDLPNEKGAEVFIIENESIRYDFIEENSGEYIWRPGGNQVFGKVGSKFDLTVINKGIRYSSTSVMNRVPTIDSLTFIYKSAGLGYREGYWGLFYAFDLEGPGDTYWIKTYKNGSFLNRPSEINIAYDAGPNAGANWDNLGFTPEIQYGVNPKDPDPLDESFYLPPYLPGDLMTVEIHSVTNEAFYFLQSVREQTDRPGGYLEVFSKPLTNNSTNIYSTGENETVLGFFNVSAVSKNSQTLQLVGATSVLVDQ